MYRTKRKIARWLLLIGIFYVVYNQITSNSLLNPYSDFHILFIQSGSMEPEIMAGEAVIIQKKETYQVGDIITYMMENQYLVTHRVQEKVEETYRTKGDHNNQMDEDGVLLSAIQGKVIFHARWLGILFQYRWYISILLWISIFWMLK